MVPVRYRVQVIRAEHAAWETELAAAVAAEIAALGLHHSVVVEVSKLLPTSEPAVAAFFGSPTAATEPTCIAAIEDAIAGGRTVVPVVEDLTRFTAETPPSIQHLNAWDWSDGGAPRLARWLLEELGIEERQRRVFISHKRDDGLLAAEYLHDHLSHFGFDPFIDRFDIAAAADVQARIEDALEECAFLLLLETPLAHASPWVFAEVDYALMHTMGVHILTWPTTVTQVPATRGLPRQALDVADLSTEKGYDVLTAAALDAVTANVEAAHADALVRRRRQILRNVEIAAEEGGHTCTPLPRWRLRVEGDGRDDIVAVADRLPTVVDLYELDRAKASLPGLSPDAAAVLVHAASRLRDERLQLLEWAAVGRPLSLVPSNAVGRYWSP